MTASTRRWTGPIREHPTGCCCGTPATLVAGDEELMRGVQLIHLPGHSPGSMALLVDLDHTDRSCSPVRLSTPTKATARSPSVAR